jgi:hypothetical protein
MLLMRADERKNLSVESVAEIRVENLKRVRTDSSALVESELRDDPKKKRAPSNLFLIDAATMKCERRDRRRGMILAKLATQKRNNGLQEARCPKKRIDECRKCYTSNFRRIDALYDQFTAIRRTLESIHTPENFPY